MLNFTIYIHFIIVLFWTLQLLSHFSVNTVSKKEKKEGKTEGREEKGKRKEGRRKRGKCCYLLYTFRIVCTSCWYHQHLQQCSQTNFLLSMLLGILVYHQVQFLFLNAVLQVVSLCVIGGEFMFIKVFQMSTYRCLCFVYVALKTCYFSVFVLDPKIQYF